MILVPILVTQHHASLGENFKLFRGGLTINLKEATEVRYKEHTFVSVFPIVSLLACLFRLLRKGNLHPGKLTASPFLVPVSLFLFGGQVIFQSLGLELFGDRWNLQNHWFVSI